jgi:hypothetical protein
MRTLPALAAALLASGCTGGDESATETITRTTIVTVTSTITTTPPATTTPPRLPAPLPAGGTLPVDDFNAYTESIDEPWERNLSEIVAAFVEAGAGDASSRSFQATSSGDGSTASASLTLDGLFDDSVRAERYEFELSRRDDGTWNVDSASWAQRCQPGRGHQTFSPKHCV